MTKTDRSNNSAFFDYCDAVGIFDEAASAKFRSDFANLGQRELIFELAKYLEFLTASDYYDFSNRFYSNWVSSKENHHPSEPSSHKKAMNFSQQQDQDPHQTLSPDAYNDTSVRVNHFEVNQSSDDPLLSSDQRESREIEQSYSKPIPAVKPQHPQSKRPNSRKEQNVSREIKTRSPQQQQFNTASNRNINKLFEMYSKLEKKMSDSTHQAAKNIEEDSPYKRRSQSPEAERSTANAQSNANRYDQLYEDHFNQIETKALKWQLYRLQELSDCTFAPKINQTKKPRDNLSETLQTPVFDRLSRVKPIKESLLQHSFDNRALKGATFSPDLSYSQGRAYKTEDTRSPEVRKSQAADRLYQKAKDKERNLMIKRFVKHNNELSGHTFQPKVHSPTKNKKAFKQELGKHVERLYSEADRRKRSLARKEAEHMEKETETYTFVPRSMTESYNSKFLQKGSNPFSRLYEEAKKRQAVSKELEKEMITRDSVVNKSIHESAKKRERQMSRSQSATDMALKRKRSTDSDQNQQFLEAGSSQFRKPAAMDTPAFDRLYNERVKREKKLKELESKLIKEQGISFKPTLVTKSYKPNRTHFTRESRSQSPSPLRH